METVFKGRARTGGGVSLIHLLVRCFAVSAAILLLADGRHADAVDPAAPVEIQQTGSSSEVADEQQWRMVRTRGNQFVVGDDDDHRPFYVNGFNTYWLMILAVDPSTRGKVTEVFQQAAAAGLTVCRTWAFNDGGWRALQKSPSVYDQDVFKVVINYKIIYILYMHGCGACVATIEAYYDFRAKNRSIYLKPAGLK
jgi:mannan endo-1,4-beta-mannosidase